MTIKGLKSWKRRVVRLLPAPWLFHRGRMRLLRVRENVWRACYQNGELELSRAGRRYSIRVRERSVRELLHPNLLLIDCQLVINGNELLAQPLPRGYWDYVD